MQSAGNPLRDALARALRTFLQTLVATFLLVAVGPSFVPGMPPPSPDALLGAATVALFAALVALAQNGLEATDRVPAALMLGKAKPPRPPRG